MSTFRSFLLVLQREAIERGRTRSYIISTAAAVAIAIVAVLGLRFVPDFFESDPRVLGVVDDAVPVVALHEAATLGDTEIDVAAFPDRASGEAALSAGEIDALVVDTGLVFEREPDAMLVNLVVRAIAEQTFEQRLAEAGLDAGQAAALLAPPEVDVTVLDPVHDDEPTGADVVVAFIATIALFGVIMSVGNTVLMGVVEEKTSRVVEVILGAMRPGALLAGKVVGIAGLGVLQLLIAVAVALIALFVLAPPDIEVPDVALTVAVLATAYVILGVAFFTFAYAAIGATVSRQEEAASAAAPLSFTLTGVYIFSITVSIQDPDGWISRVAALVPPFSPVAMPPRLALGDVAAWEIAVSLTLMVVATALIIRLGERIYTAGILRQGPRVGLLQALRSRERVSGR